MGSILPRGLSGLTVQGCVIENAAKDDLYMISDSHVLVTQNTLSGAGEGPVQLRDDGFGGVERHQDSSTTRSIRRPSATSFVAVYAVDAIGAGSTVTDVTVAGNTVHIPLTSANETDGIVVNGNTTGSVSRVSGGGE